MNFRKSTKRKARIVGWIISFLVLGFAVATFLNSVPAPEAQTDPVLPGGRGGSFSALAKKVSVSVVNIRTVKIVEREGQVPLPFGQENPFRDFFERYFRDRMPENFRQQSLGSGFIISKDGDILTNNHVVENSDEIRVRLSDDQEFSAKIIGRDAKTDLALIRIETGRPLVPLPLGDSDKLEVGDWVVAIGNPFGLGNTVTAGIVSAKYRQIGTGAYENFIQTDASINPGNSGGPLLNTVGEVVGINTAIFSQSGGSVGIGFAIPVNMAKDLIPQLKKGKVVRGWLGVMIQNISPELKNKLGLKDTKGALVADIVRGGPAEEAGIKRGDVIISFDGKQIEQMKDLPYIVASTPVGKVVTVEVMRQGRPEKFEVKILEMKEKTEPPVLSKLKADLGMTVKEIDPRLAGSLGLSETSGLVVVQVEENGPAAEVGMRPGDLILEVDQDPVKDLEQFEQKIDEYKAGETILFLVKRQGTTQYVTLRKSG